MLKKKPEKALITAEAVYANAKHALHPFPLTKAILAFLPIGELNDRFCKNNGQPIKWGNYWNTWVRDDGAILAGPIFGGPMCAVIVEELAAAGVKHFIGYGASGTLDDSVPPGSIHVADAGLCSDGTTKEYSSRKEEPADAELLKLLRDEIKRRGLPDIGGKVWTTDAIYREYPSTVAHWKKKGARFVNMDTSPLYAVANEKGVKAVYLSAISDNVSGKKWSGWYPDFGQALEQIWDITLAVLDSL
jgi:purine-nucleoside phosphorylase